MTFLSTSASDLISNRAGIHKFSSNESSRTTPTEHGRQHLLARMLCVHPCQTRAASSLIFCRLRYTFKLESLPLNYTRCTNEAVTACHDPSFRSRDNRAIDRNNLVHVTARGEGAQRRRGAGRAILKQLMGSASPFFAGRQVLSGTFAFRSPRYSLSLSLGHSC